MVTVCVTGKGGGAWLDFRMSLQSAMGGVKSSRQKNTPTSPQ